MAKGAAKKGRGTGTPNKKAIGAANKNLKGKTLNPWGGPNIPNRAVGQVNGIGQSGRSRTSSTAGSSMRKPSPSPQLRGMSYPPNDPLLWPVEIDKVNHKRQPSASGITPTVITNVNASIEQAYHRAKYQ